MIWNCYVNTLFVDRRYNPFISLTILEEDEEKIRTKRLIPYAGQALQATSQVLNHPIVAAALQKISMDALATVASALNQVSKSEKAKKSHLEMAKTLDKMAMLHQMAKAEMPMLEDGTGSGKHVLCLLCSLSGWILKVRVIYKVLLWYVYWFVT